MSRTWPAGIGTISNLTGDFKALSGFINIYIYIKAYIRTPIFHPCRFAKEYSASPGRGYGSGVIQVLKKLASPQLADVFQPARDQFNGRGSFGNGGAMRAVPFALAFPDLVEVKRVSGDLSM